MIRDTVRRLVGVAHCPWAWWKRTWRLRGLEESEGIRHQITCNIFYRCPNWLHKPVTCFLSVSGDDGLTSGVDCENIRSRVTASVRGARKDSLGYILIFYILLTLKLTSDDVCLNLDNLGVIWRSCNDLNSPVQAWLKAKILFWKSPFEVENVHGQSQS